MADNFIIATHRNSDSLHLKLKGDFDDHSAHELFEIIKKSFNNTLRIFVHTNSLNNILAFNRLLFLRNLQTLKKQNSSILFTGDRTEDLFLE